MCRWPLQSDYYRSEQQSISLHAAAAAAGGRVMSRRTNELAIYQQTLIERVVRECNPESIDGEMFQLRLLSSLSPPPLLLFLIIFILVAY